MKTSELIVAKEQCTGCGACSAICPKNAITLCGDKEGFLYPNINEEACIDCKVCISICPCKKRFIKDDKMPNGNSIGLVNLQITDNFGANLLAYSMEKTIHTLFPNADVITIKAAVKPKRLSADEKINKKAVDFIAKLKKYNIRLPFMYFSEKRASKQVSILNKERHLLFENFRNSFLNLSQICFTAEDIKKLPIDTLILGSDIVWNPSRAAGEGTDMFFATGFNDNYKRISYAASLGTDDLEILTPLRDTYLLSVDSISVREDSAKSYLAPLTDKQISVNCDPCFLLEKSEWECLANKTEVPKEKYIFVYLLGRCNDGVKAAKKLAKEKGLKIYYCGNQGVSIKNGVNCCKSGPLEFLGFIKNAEYVITNSFHSVVFSIIFEKKFKVYSRKDQFSKLVNILDKLSLEDRYNPDISIDNRINFDKAWDVIKSEKKEAFKYLKRAVNE